MTVVHMSEKGQIAVPKEIRDRRGFCKGSLFAVLETQSGALVFRQVNPKPKMDLVDRLRRLKGLEIPETHFHCPPRI
jgi:AbrB family looped-hinge helix DNA binding protein